jgi:broad specificity phosphatase PhoE
VITRVERFWKTEILPLRHTDSNVLVVSHGGILSTLRKHLLEQRNYKVDESLMASATDFWEVRNCSVTEISIGEKGPGKFIRMGASGHLLGKTEDLANSTG